MATPTFVPLVGSGFDSLASQGQYWAGFNQRQEEANLARMQQAEQAQNQWFSRLAEMQQQENQRRDRMDLAAQEEARRAAEGQQSLAYNAAQNALARKENDRRMKLEEDRFAFQKTQADDEKKKQLKVVSNFATNFAPEFQDTAKSLEDAAKANRLAQDAVLRRKSEIEAEKDFPRTDVHFDAKLHEFVPNEKVRGMPTKLEGRALEIVQSANKELAGLSADFLTAQAELKQRQSEWADKLKHASAYNLVPKKGKTGWSLYSPDLDMTFGQMVQKAKEAATEPEGIVWQGYDSPSQVTPQAPAKSQPNPVEPGMSPIGGNALDWSNRQVPSFTVPTPAQPPVGAVTKVWKRGPNGRLMLVQ